MLKGNGQWTPSDGKSSNCFCVYIHKMSMDMTMFPVCLVWGLYSIVAMMGTRLVRVLPASSPSKTRELRTALVQVKSSNSSVPSTLHTNVKVPSSSSTNASMLKSILSIGTSTFYKIKINNCKWLLSNYNRMAFQNMAYTIHSSLYNLATNSY